MRRAGVRFTMGGLVAAAAVAAVMVPVAGGATASQIEGIRIDCTSALRDPDAIRGTARADRLVGTPGDDVIIGNGGADTIAGRGGNDVIIGGPGNDTLRGQDGDDALCGGPGDDRITANAGSDRVAAGPGRDFVTSGSGGADGDWIRGDGGRDEIVLDSYFRGRVDGGPGGDVIAVRAPLTGRRTLDTAPIVVGGSGPDVISSGPSARGVYRFFAGTGDDEVSGDAGTDVIDLGPGNDIGRGFGGDDSIAGGEGSDTIYGQEGVDTVDAGPGTDSCFTSEKRTGCEILGAP